MARIRNTGPEQWVDDDFVSCQPLARLLALALRNFCDDNGVFRWSPLKLKMLCLPGDNLDDVGGIEALLTELEGSRQIRRYHVEDRTYGIIRNLRTYNKPRRPYAVHPLPVDLVGHSDYLTPRLSATSTDNVGHLTDLCDGEETDNVGHVTDNVRQEADNIGRQDANVPPDMDMDMDMDIDLSSDPPNDLPVDNSKSPTTKKGKSKPYTPEFDAAWEVRPRREGTDDKRLAFRAWEARRKEGQMPDEMLAGWLRYRAHEEAAGNINTPYVMQGATFFGPADPPHFDAIWEIPEIRENTETDPTHHMDHSALMALADQYGVVTYGKSTDEVKAAIRRSIDIARSGVPTIDLRR